MAGVVKKGLLDVKTKGKLGSTYKRRYVILRRNTDEGTKGVEIMDHEGDNEDMEYLPLSGVWTVQDKASQNKKRYAFELVIGPHIVMTFSCPSMTEREEWTESFHILNRVSPYSPPMNAPDMYPVSLERNMSAVEISVSGPCLLRIQDKAIVLYSECGRNKLHHWAADNIKNVTLDRDQLKLEAYRPGSETLMDFCFNTEIEVGRLILTSWNMALMRSVDPQKLNLISSYILNQNEMIKDGGGGGGGGGSKSVSLSKNFFGSLKQKGMNGVKEEKGVRRVKSFSEKMQNEIRVSPDPHNASSRLSIASQESYTINSVPQQQGGSDEEYRLSPPPIPPRAPRRPHSLGMDMTDALRPDPDYSTIPDHAEPTKSLEIKRIEMPSSRQNTSTSSAASLDKELDDLLKDIEEDNQRKVQRRLTLDSSTTHRISPIVPFETSSKSRTIGGGSLRYSENFVRQKKEFYNTHGPSHEASDYLEPVPSQRAATQEDPKRASNPQQLTSYLLQKDTPEDLLLQQIKRHSTSGDFSSLRIKDTSSHHDYSIIPDKVTNNMQQHTPITPQHFHTASTDSTQSAPELPPPRFSRRSQGPLEHDPPSPIGAPHSPTKILRTSTASGVEDIISPYATSKGLSIEKATINTDPSPPPLPPRSPVRHLRERVSMPSVTGQRCTHCNGMKTKQSLVKTHSLADHHPKHHHAHHHTHHHHAHSSNDVGSLPDLWGKVSFTTDPYSTQTSQSSESSQSTSSKGHPSSSSRNPSQSSEEATPSLEHDQSLELALQKLDECVKGLKILGTSEPDSTTTASSTNSSSGGPRRSHSTKDRHASTIDQALSNTQQIQSDLLMAKKEHRKSYDQLHRSSTVSGTHSSSSSKRSPPSNSRHTMTGHRSSPSVSELDATTPPVVPPRSFVSLHSTPSPPTHLDGSGGVAAHTPIHRYLSQNTPDKSNTVFIYHMKESMRIGANTHSSIV